MNKSKIVIITGASSGIGAASARLLAKKDHSVVLAARRMARLEALAKEIDDAGGQALPVGVDITQLEDIQRLISKTIDHFGRVDILINNAGFGRMNWLEKLDPHKEIEIQIQTNLIGLILTTRETIPYMITQRSGHIINIASVASFVATPTYSIYAASKFGVRGFTDALRNEVGIFGIHVSALYPGTVETEFQDQVGYQRKTGIKPPTSIVLSAEDVARNILEIIDNPRRSVIIPRPLRLAIWLNTIFPGLSDRIIVRRFVIPERLG